MTAPLKAIAKSDIADLMHKTGLRARTAARVLALAPARQKDDALEPQIKSTAGLAKHPNVYVKLTLVPVFSTAPYPYKNIQPCIRQLLEAFGPRRCFWGTDVSAMLQRTSCSYGQCVKLFTEHMDFISAADREWIMGRALAECLNWPIKT